MIRTGAVYRTLALLPLALAAPRAVAQVDTGVVRASSTWQREVDRLRTELLSQRTMEREFARTLGTLRARLVVPVDTERADIEAQSQLLYSKLRENQTVQLRLRRQLETLCAAVRQPEGWLGVATTGFSLIDREPDGTKIVRFMDQPVIESVDPGSPADRVGLKSGDVLLEIGGKRLLRTNVVFAELLRPGERVTVKIQRGGETMVVAPVVETVPQQMSETPCSGIDAGVSYVLAPMPVPRGYKYEVEISGRPSSGVPLPRATRDSAVRIAPPATFFTGPMAQVFVGGGNVLAGMHFVALNEESGRSLGVAYGLFVNEVAAGTPGREAGLQGGDVLIRADSFALRSVGALQRAMRASSNRAIRIVLMRDKKQESVTLKW